MNGVRVEMALLVGAGLVVAMGCSSEGEKLEPDPSVTTSTGTSSSNGGAGGTGGDAQTSSSSTGGGGTGGEATGGGSTNDDAAGYVSGSRLRAKYIEGSDGSKHFVSFFDSQMGSDCAYRESDEGLRCLPPVVVPSFSGVGFNISTRYSDSACDVKAPTAEGTCGNTPTHVTEGSNCNATGTHAVTGTVQGYRRQGTSCVQALEQVWTTQPVPLTDWVEGTTMTE